MQEGTTLSQLEQVMRQLTEEGKITFEEAQKHIGTHRLPALIYILRKNGWKIATEVERRTVYVLKEKPNDTEQPQ